MQAGAPQYTEGRMVLTSEIRMTRDWDTIAVSARITGRFHSRFIQGAGTSLYVFQFANGWIRQTYIGRTIDHTGRYTERYLIRRPTEKL